MEEDSQAAGIHSTFKNSFKIRRAARFGVPNCGENSTTKMSIEIGDGEANIWYYSRSPRYVVAREVKSVQLHQTGNDRLAD